MPSLPRVPHPEILTFDLYGDQDDGFVPPSQTKKEWEFVKVLRERVNKKDRQQEANQRNAVRRREYKLLRRRVLKKWLRHRKRELASGASASTPART